MQLSKKNIDPQLNQKIYQIFFQVIADLNNEQEANLFLRDLLTQAELTAIAKRLAIAQLLQQGESYDQIRKKLKVSSATIAAVQERLNSDTGLKLALQKIKTAEWADAWTDRILTIVGGKKSEQT